MRGKALSQLSKPCNHMQDHVTVNLVKRLPVFLQNYFLKHFMVTTFLGKQGGTSDMMDSYEGMCPCETV